MSWRGTILVRLAAVTMLGSSALGLVTTVPAASAQVAPAGDSAVTVSGKDEFANLKVTISQTKNLISQTVHVSWTGGAPTVNQFNGNFLQIMQCWGDDPATGPDRTQCQFGAIKGSAPNAGSAVRGRLVTPLDPAERGLGLAPDPANPAGANLVPFWPVGGERPTTFVNSDTNDFYDAQITNEVPIAITRPDGTGQVDFEIQTGHESTGLGCGEPVDVNGTTTGRPCWLVIVPRGIKEFDGSVPPSGLHSSPFYPATWAKKIAVPLDFRPQGRPCPLGAPERRLTGHELVVDAVSQWQPKLCANGGALYSFAQLSDDLARSQLLDASDPGLALISNPVPPDQQRPERPLVYAPVALSGLAFAFNILAAPPNVFKPAEDPRSAVTGKPFTEMKLTPRLVAKLLTQSYKGALPGFGLAVPEGQGPPAQPARLGSNPNGLTNDPEFLDLNPEYQADPNPAFPNRDLLKPNLYIDTLVQLGTSDLTGRLWDWVLADPDARKFVDGSPDPWGMVVNDANKGLQPPLNTYPRNDKYCRPVGGGAGSTGFVPFCTGDEHQVANDMHEAARAASRGTQLGLDSASPKLATDGTVTFAKKPRQDITELAAIAVVDAATADRYGLPTAKLCNAARECVAPDAAGLLAGLDAMKPSGVPGVPQPDPATRPAAAYPLTSVSYAVTSPPALTEVAGREYAAFIRYAVGDGQQPGLLPGQLPPGYVPLPEPLRQQALAAAAKIEAEAGKSTESTSPSAPTGPAAPAPALSAPAAPNTAPPGDTAPPGGTAPNQPVAPVPTPPAVIPPGVPPVVAQEPVTQARRTPATTIAAMGGLLVALLVSGALAAGLAPVARRLGAPTRAAPDKQVPPTGP